MNITITDLNKNEVSFVAGGIGVTGIILGASCVWAGYQLIQAYRKGFTYTNKTALLLSMAIPVVAALTYNEAYTTACRRKKGSIEPGLFNLIKGTVADIGYKLTGSDFHSILAVTLSGI